MPAAYYSPLVNDEGSLADSDEDAQSDSCSWKNDHINITVDRNGNRLYDTVSYILLIKIVCTTDISFIFENQQSLTSLVSTAKKWTSRSCLGNPTSS
jgi:hypothetical protein